MDPLSEMLGRLRSRGIEPRRSGTGWSSRCPAHDDQTPSLSIDHGDDGRVLVHCHAGCRFTDVATALGMAPQDLFPENSRATPSWSARAPSRLMLRQSTTGRPSQLPPKSFATWADALRTSAGPPTALWLYHDTVGRAIGAVARFPSGVTGKTFRQASLSENGTWVAKGMPTPRPLYQLPALLASRDTVYVVEGEKCADAVTRLGLIATTSIGGASNARHSDWKPLAGRRVVIIPDADEQGSKYASDVADLASRVGAADVRIANIATIWPGVPPKGDIADWVAMHCSPDPSTLRALLERQATEAAVVPPPVAHLVTSARRLWPRQPSKTASRRLNE